MAGHGIKIWCYHAIIQMVTCDDLQDILKGKEVPWGRVFWHHDIMNPPTVT